MPKIFVLSGPDVGASFDVQAGSVLGRAEECRIRLHDASVSRQHARLDLANDVWRVVDLGSRNGMFVGEERVGESVLQDGSEFRLGEVLVRFRVTAAAAPAVAAEVPARAARPEPQVSDEIVLEGDWDEAVAARAHAVPSAPPVEVATRTPTGPSLARQQATARLAQAGALPRSGAGGSRGVLQFSKVEDSGAGFMGSDFDQQPLWIKAAIGLLGLVVCAGVAWAAFRGVLLLKGGSHQPAAIEDDADEAR